MKCCPWCHREVHLKKASGLKAVAKTYGNWLFGGPRFIAKEMFTHVNNIRKAVSSDDPILNAIEREWECPLCQRLILECGYCGKLHKWDNQNMFTCSCGASI